MAKEGSRTAMAADFFSSAAANARSMLQRSNLKMDFYNQAHHQSSVTEQMHSQTFKD